MSPIEVPFQGTSAYKGSMGVQGLTFNGPPALRLAVFAAGLQRTLTPLGHIIKRKTRETLSFNEDPRIPKPGNTEAVNP